MRLAIAALLLASCAPDAPKPSSSQAHAAAPAPQELCEHKVPAALCTKHHPELVPVFKSQGDWCDEHGVPMSHCFAHNPNLTFTTTADWCKEHALPESKCTKCHPELVAKFIEAGDYCREHGYPESVCPLCHPELPSQQGQPAPLFPDPSTKVRLASEATAADVGIKTMRVALAPFQQTLEVTGQLELNGNAQAQISTKDDARILAVLVDVGDVVKAGQPLVVLASASAGADRAGLAAANARVSAAQSALARLQQLEGITAPKNVDEARRELAVAEAERDAALAALSASGADVGSAQAGSGKLVLTSPSAGTVVARDAVPGRTVTPGTVLVHVADTRKLWATLDVPEEESASVRAGQPVELRFEGLKHQPSLQAQIARVGASIEPHTRTVRARVDVDNADGKLKAGLFIRARIAVSDERQALLLPLVAVQRAEGKHIVFLKQEPGVYQPVAVSVGESDGDVVEVVAGLAPGTEVVTTGAFLLKTELIKDSIGAGCCDDD